MINSFDQYISEFLNLSSSQHYIAVKIAWNIAGNDLLKGMFVVSILWWVWLKDTGRLINQDLFSVRTIAGAFLAVVVGRLAQILLPMRLRPFHNPDIDFTIVDGIFEKSPLEGWSSFPSDHAVLFFAIATAIWVKSRPIGILVFAWSFFIICLPRVYLGFHYLTDILAGVVLGIAIMYICLKVPLPSLTWGFLNGIENRHSAILYATVFLISLQIATLFDSVRGLARGGIKVLSIVMRAYT